MEFIIIRDEFSDSDTEAQADTKSTKSKKSTKSVATHSTDAYSDAESVRIVVFFKWLYWHTTCTKE